MFWTRFYQPLTSRNALTKNTPLFRGIITRLAATFTSKEVETPGPAKTRAKTTKKKFSELPEIYILPSGSPAAPLPDLFSDFATGIVAKFFRNTKCSCGLIEPPKTTKKTVRKPRSKKESLVLSEKEDLVAKGLVGETILFTWLNLASLCLRVKISNAYRTISTDFGKLKALSALHTFDQSRPIL